MTFGPKILERKEEAVPKYNTLQWQSNKPSILCHVIDCSTVVVEKICMNIIAPYGTHCMLPFDPKYQGQSMITAHVQV